MEGPHALRRALPLVVHDSYQLKVLTFVGISTGNLTALTAFRPTFKPFNNTWKTSNPFVKLTTQLNPDHVLSGYYVYDRSFYTSHREFDEDPITFQSGGGSLVQARLSSLWGQHLTSELSIAYNTKHNYGNDTYIGNMSFPLTLASPGDVDLSASSTGPRSRRRWVHSPARGPRRHLCQARSSPHFHLQLSRLLN